MCPKRPPQAGAGPLIVSAYTHSAKVLQSRPTAALSVPAISATHAGTTG